MQQSRDGKVWVASDGCQRPVRRIESGVGHVGPTHIQHSTRHLVFVFSYMIYIGYSKRIVYIIYICVYFTFYKHCSTYLQCYVSCNSTKKTALLANVFLYVFSKLSRQIMTPLKSNEQAMQRYAPQRSSAIKLIKARAAFRH